MEVQRLTETSNTMMSRWYVYWIRLASRGFIASDVHRTDAAMLYAVTTFNDMMIVYCCCMDPCKVPTISGGNAELSGTSFWWLISHYRFIQTKFHILSVLILLIGKTQDTDWSRLVVHSAPLFILSTVMQNSSEYYRDIIVACVGFKPYPTGYNTVESISGKAWFAFSMYYF